MVGNFYPDELELAKENADKHWAGVLDLDIKIRNEKFQVGLLERPVSFLYCQCARQIK